MLPDPTFAELTLGAVLRRVAELRGERPALLGDGRELSWAELDAEVDRIAALLHSVGVAKGDVVAFMLTKRPEVVVGFLACARLGALYAPVNFKLHPDHIRDQFQTAGIQTIFVETAFDQLLKGLLPELPDPRRIIYVGEMGRLGESHYDDLAELPAPDVDLDIDDPCYLNYTSGTTGRPKGAVTTHRNINVQGLTAFDLDGDGLGFTSDHVFLGMFSVFAHPHELFHRSLLCGGAFVIMDSLNPRVIATTIERFGVSWMMAVPSFYEMLLDHVADGGADISSLSVLESGGAFVSADTLRRMEDAFGAAFMPVWGSTETTGVAVAMRPDRPRRPGCTGRPVRGYEIRLVDRQGRDVATGEVGEMIVRGEAVVSGYLNNPEETELLFEDGWYHTRDLVTRTEEGFLSFVGRRSEMLKIGGIRVYPLEIEKVVKDHPEVRDVVVVRAEERIRGEIARCVVELNPGATLTVRGVQKYCRNRLAVYKVPRVVEFWDEIPKLPNGKIDKKAVVARPMDPARDERES
ncbi:MAG TPA: class I adenylate-forming enzyme family protein [Myxococcota bacterium]|nr:class I adenylate-forming enzyme family protein [Myxococcota bacterium]